MPRQPYFVLSFCGTSLLTNGLEKVDQQLLRDQTNSRSEQEVPAEYRARMRELLEKQKANFLAATIQKAEELSAEFKGISKLYQGNLVSPPGQSPDEHVLLCTDTWQGEIAAQSVRERLRQRGFNAHVERRKDLHTAEIESFQLALADLVIWCADNIPNYRKAGYHIIFNLTAGFKSIQGFLQTLAMFHADESIYVFESNTAPLLVIPRLPIKMHPDDAIQSNLYVFRRLWLKLDVSPNELENVAETLLMRLGNEFSLSAWGTLVWEQTYRQIYEQKIWPSPSPKIRYGNKFEESVKSIESHRITQVNQKIDDLSAYLEGKGANLRSLDFKELRGNPLPPNTHEMDAWADQDAKRLFGYFDGEVFVLDRLGKALH